MMSVTVRPVSISQAGKRKGDFTLNFYDCDGLLVFAPAALAVAQHWLLRLVITMADHEIMIM
jgi:hypothetical protein